LRKKCIHVVRVPREPGPICYAKPTDQLFQVGLIARAPRSPCDDQLYVFPLFRQ
jgi:hypothetical protein